MRVVTVILATCSIWMFSCSEESRFPTEKRFWTSEDYRNVIWEITYKTPKGEEYPRFSSPNTSIVILKLVDHQNYEVVLDDPELGLNHRNEIAQAFFDEYRSLYKLYNVTDKQDMYVYSDELIDIQKFGLGLQLKYFKLGNDRIIEQADNPEASSITYLIKSNESTIISNFNNYIDNVNDERYYSETSLSAFADGLTFYFSKLIETFPNGNFDPIIKKASLLVKKSKNPEIILALNNLILKLEATKQSNDLNH